MEERFSRTEMLLGSEKLALLAQSKVAIFGVGGVGGYVAEALARSAVGAFDLFDKDVVALSNLNRQIVATMQTIGQHKVDVMQNRILSINPGAKVKAHKVFYMPNVADEYDLAQYDYVIDAIDTVTAKLELAVRAQQAGVPIISSMGAGNKLDPTQFKVADIYQTSVCPLARVMRRELKKRGVKRLKVVYSLEQAKTPDSREDASGRVSVPGSVAFVPSVAGLIIAAQVVKDLTE